ncbi:peptidylprolyl isomerase [Candidatus Woesearchaeota archaeon]|jgi:FKBP-type peptidyl-prolyl cis-trans isomerase 2|nr:peptidylprolyl isomerase [Candidatus Woesearchaeota archaeon]|tara:strand:- start:514 stop:942 length:429 start_codon:yes stop_codon:yes gene_type:complete
MTIKKGDKVSINYTGSFDDGKVFDSSEKHEKPLEFEVGTGKVIKGFDNAVIGMNKGEKKDFKIESKDAYGDRNPQLVQKVPRDKLPKDKELKSGMVMALKSPDGKQIPAMLTEVNDKEVTIDINHPLAGKTLNFKIEIVSIN